MKSPSKSESIPFSQILLCLVQPDYSVFESAHILICALKIISHLECTHRDKRVEVYLRACVLNPVSDADWQSLCVVAIVRVVEINVLLMELVGVINYEDAIYHLLFVIEMVVGLLEYG